MPREQRDIEYNVDVLRDYAKQLQKGDKVYFLYKCSGDTGGFRFMSKEWHGFIVQKYPTGATVSYKLPKMKKAKISFFTYKELLLRDRVVYNYAEEGDEMREKRDQWGRWATR